MQEKMGRWYQTSALEFRESAGILLIQHSPCSFREPERTGGQGSSWTAAVASAGSGKGNTMKYAGLLVMPSGFFLAIAALALFPDPGRRGLFVVCGLLVEALGLGVA